ncbi:UDP-N-acetylmuramoyl-tripeptide--D-alanyl-D-alanine ligase [Paratractidigestivibacter sp.]|uniref:UDP-N-acetylmuramoyl-tripeptide--D-alanyl-D- alanine ligase n=1 Tax=Paratractidigestivibacter sp. TaxID=2847316 RepID=UPI002ABDBE73|nr:UDP-N-acetylmuramoyl-tripeptide--D-alanyl-D-alanine ligase [Paratractidigestivibacter sp.]
MIRISVQDIAAATGAELIYEGSREVAGDVVIDSRQVGEGSVFVAFAGEKVDGNAYLASSAAAGAACVVASAEPADVVVEACREVGCSLIRAADDDCEAFLLALAAYQRSLHPEWLVVGVTGSVGKTTTKDMLRAGFGATLPTHATAGNFNNLIGLPLTVLAAPEGARVLVCELGMNHPHEIDRLAAACSPTLACVTTIGTSHIGILGSRENIARAKAEVVSGMRGSSEAAGDLAPCLVMPSGCDLTSFIADEFARPAGVEVCLVGARDGDEVRARGVRLDESGLPSFTVSCADGWSREVTLNLPGKKVVDDFLLAIALIWRAGADRDAAAVAIESMEHTALRLDVRDSAAGARVIDDSYNAAPNSMASSLDILAAMACEGSRVAVLGEMGELGDDARALHGCVGAYAAAKGLDMLVFIGGELADCMAEAARAMGASEDCVHRFATAEEAAAALKPVFTAGDVVLVKASRSEGLDRFAKEVLS